MIFIVVVDFTNQIEDNENQQFILSKLLLRLRDHGLKRNSKSDWRDLSLKNLKL